MASVGGSSPNVNSSLAPRVKDLPAPVSPDALLTTREKVILLKGSKLHGCKFPPWQASDANLVQGSGNNAPWEDDTEFHLSEAQRENFAGWKRTQDRAMATSLKTVRIEAEARQVDLVQDVTSDCSVVASLCAETARVERLGLGRESLVKAALHPCPGSDSKVSKFAVKLNFNGCFRRVEIDDRLPTSKTTKRALHVFDRGDPEGTVWPALIEKAYLKVRGGYDFPGSNSGTDLYVLTGWVPEQLFLQSDDIMPNAFWKKLYQAFTYGDVLVTMGTPSMGRKEEESLGLAGEHAYALVDMKEVDGRREFLIKNPWSEAGVWTGSVAMGEEYRMKHPKEAMMPGTFWMDLNNVFSNFETIYLNWNPGLFTHRRDVHFTWDLATRSSHGSFLDNPQYTIVCDKKSTVWILLSKHFQSFERPEGGLDPDDLDPRLQIGHLSLYAYEGEYRVALTDGALQRAPYVDAPNILLRFEAQAQTPYTIVVSEQGLPTSKFDFSLSTFTRSPVSVHEAKRRYSHCITQSGAWTFTTAGGHASSPEYSTNPQFSLTLPKDSDVAIVLEADDPDFAIHVKLIWAGGKRIPSNISKKDIFGDSKEYRRGCALAEIHHVNAGTYTIICSTFKQGQMGRFSLKVWSMSEHCIMQPIPIHVPGMFSLRLEPAVFTQGTDRVLVPLTVLRLTRLHIRARSIEREVPSSRSPVRVTVEFGQGSNSVVLASTDKFVEATGGIRTPDVDVKPAMCGEDSPGVWIVVERMGGSCLEAPEVISVEIFSSEKGVKVGPWGKQADEKIEELQEKMAASSVSSRASR